MILPFQKNNHQKLFPLLLLLFTLLLPISVSAQSFDEDFLPTMEQVYDAVPYMEDSVTDNLEFTIDEQDSTPIEERLNNTTNKISSLLSKTSLLILFFSVVVLYIFFGVTQQKVAERLGLERSWQAWVPILRRIQLFKMGDQNPWFILLFLVPVLGQLATTVLTFIVYCKIAEKLGHDKLLGLLPLIPVGVFIMWGIFAWNERNNPIQPQAPQPYTQPIPEPTQFTPQVPQTPNQMAPNPEAVPVTPTSEVPPQI